LAVEGAAGLANILNSNQVAASSPCFLDEFEGVVCSAVLWVVDVVPAFLDAFLEVADSLRAYPVQRHVDVVLSESLTTAVRASCGFLFLLYMPSTEDALPTSLFILHGASPLNLLWSK